MMGCPAPGKPMLSWEQRVHKLLMLLGILRQGPMSGYDLHRFVRAHGEVSADLKKANVYYLLDRLAADGYLHVQAEAGARGPRGERLIYTLTDLGRARFDELLREVLRSYDTVHTGVDVAVMFLGQLSQDEALNLLEERRQTIAGQRSRIAAEMSGEALCRPTQRIARDHLLSLLDAELAWTERTLELLRDSHWAENLQKKQEQSHGT
jgi:DNA-binding PadR family transcriptional regulator